MIITAQPFLNELDLLELKFRELEGVVDLHVVIESPLTFTGIPKPLVFAENAARFARWPVHHVVFDPPKVTPSPWEREHAQRCLIYDTIEKLSPEIAIYCDTDECPRRSAIEFYAERCFGIRTFEMDQLLFFFDRIDTTIRWTNVKVWRPRLLPKGHETPWRGTVCETIPDAGWHFEYFGRRDVLLEKLHAVSHAPDEGCVNMRRKVEAGELPGIERTVPYQFDKLPSTVLANLERWAPQFRDPCFHRTGGHQA